MLGERIKTLREAEGWSQGELARRAGITQAYVSQLETGKRTGESIGVEVLQKLATAFGLTLDGLVHHQLEDLTDPPLDMMRALHWPPAELAEIEESWVRQPLLYRLRLIRLVRTRYQDQQAADRTRQAQEDEIRALLHGQHSAMP